ncbi:fibronectin type III domain-containing protein, partial [Candidatus Woesearchaeota archaeon]|nr:fibronectin type III domain-containing protein [Candidatus Woesearchaeota archaeon]
MKRKTRIAISLFIITIMLGLTVEAADALRIFNVGFQNIGSNNATVVWETDADSDSTVFYGVTRPPSQRVESLAYTQNHSITLTNLMPDREYLVDVQSRTATEFASANNNTRSYTFRTKPQLEPEDIQLNTSLPAGNTAATAEYVNVDQITITGTTLPGTTIRIYVNSKTIPSQIIENGKYSLDVGSTGEFTATVKLFETVYQGMFGLNEITILFIGPAGDQQKLTRTVIVDTTAPIIYIEDLDSTRKSETVQLKGAVSEESNVSFSVDSSQFEQLPLDSELEFSKDVTLSGEGKHNITVMASDKAANNATNTVEVEVDTTPCTLKLDEEVFREKQRFSIITINGTT